MDKAVEIVAIDAALATLLSATYEWHTKYAGRPARRSPSGTLFRDPLTISPVEALIDDPIGQSCRLGIRRLGERLHELDEGRSQLMHAVINRLSKINSGWAETVDKWWQGIGGWTA